MFAIEVQTSFSAAHALRLPDGGLEPLHGHDFHVTVKIACDELDALGTVMDFHDVQLALDVIVGAWRNQNLNELEPFRTKLNPSAEQIAQTIGNSLAPAIPDLTAGNRHLRLIEIRLTEAVGCLAIWSPD